MLITQIIEVSGSVQNNSGAWRLSEALQRWSGTEAGVAGVKILPLQLRWRGDNKLLQCTCKQQGNEWGKLYILLVYLHH